MREYPIINEAGDGFLLSGEPWSNGHHLEAAMSFHTPEGLAAVRDHNGAWHMDLDGAPAYPERYLEVCGFYEGIAAVRDGRGWFHISPDGRPLHERRFRWSGNYQGGRCVVLTPEGYLHITPAGSDAYPQRFRYAGDFRYGLAVAFSPEGALHIRPDGSRLADATWAHAEPYHKGWAVVADDKGYFHVDLRSRPLGPMRFSAAEPFYNGRALCRDRRGRLLRLRPNGTWTRIAEELVPISAEEVRHRIRAGAEVGLFLRHAERAPITPETPNWGNDVLLTEQGIEAARCLGRYIAETSPLALWSSPVERCRQTCAAIAVGAGVPDTEIHSHRHLGDPGLYLDGSGNHVEPMRRDFDTFATGYLDNGVAPGMRPHSEASEELLGFLGEQMSGHACTFFITHDFFAAALMGFLGLKAPDPTDWCNYLEGVCLIREGEEMVVRRFIPVGEEAAC